MREIIAWVAQSRIQLHKQVEAYVRYADHLYCVASLIEHRMASWSRVHLCTIHLCFAPRALKKAYGVPSLQNAQIYLQYWGNSVAQFLQFALSTLAKGEGFQRQLFGFQGQYKSSSRRLDFPLASSPVWFGPDVPRGTTDAAI